MDKKDLLVTIVGFFTGFASVGQTVLAEGQKNENPARPLLEEVIVTAQKREQNVFDVPMSITALGGEEIAKKGIDNFDDLKFSVPGIGMYEEGAGKQTVFMRGVGNLEGNASLTTTYLDEIPTNTGGGATAISVISQMFPLQYVDLERIEVLHGPQGTLYGAGAVGGTIRYISKDPQLDRVGAKGDASLSFTKNGDPSQKATAIVNIPVVEGEFGLRIASTIGRLGGYIDMPDLGQTDVNNQDLEQVRIKALWQPGDRFSARATVVVHRNDADAGSNIGDEDLNFRPVPVIPEIAVPFRDEAELYNLTLNYDTDFARLLSSTTYMQRDNRTSGYVAGTEETLFPTYRSMLDYEVGNEVFTQEVRATSGKTEPWSWTVGAFYRDRTARQSNITNWTTFDGALTTSITNGLVNELTNESWAVFADANYTFFDRLELGAGVRYFEEDSVGTQHTSGARASASSDATTWRAYASYDITDAVKAYVNVGTGFRPGGPNLSSTVQFLLPGHGSETLISYEAGTKLSLLGGRMRAGLALFYSEYQDVLFRHSTIIGTNAVNLIDNVGTADVEGIDAYLDWQISDGLSLYVNGTVTDGEIVELSSDTVAAVVVGDPLNYVPEYTYSVGMEQQFDWSRDVPGFVRLDYNRRGKAFTVGRTANPNIDESDVLGFLNARIGVQWERWAFELFGDNLLDENGSVMGDDFGVTPRPRPRTIGIRVGVDFMN